MAINFSSPSFSFLVPGKLVLLGDALSSLVEPVLSIGDTATANGGLVIVEGTLTGVLRCMRVDSGLLGATANTLRTALASGLLAAIVVELVGGHAVDGLAEASVNLRRGGTTESLRGGGLVVRGLGGGLLGVACVRCVGWGGASREDLCAELGNGIVANKDTGLVLKAMLVNVVVLFETFSEALTPSWFSREAPAGLGLNSPEPPVGIWLVRASVLLLVEDIAVYDWVWRVCERGFE